MRVRVALVWTPDGAKPDHVVETDADGWITAVRPARDGDPEALPGLLVPGLVNAHTHLELSGLAGMIPAGRGMIGWIDALVRVRRQATREAAAAGARALTDAGTALACDITNAGDTVDLLADAGLAGVVQHEFLGLDRAAVDGKRVAMANAGTEEDGPGGVIRCRPTVHALYSTAPDLLDAAVGFEGLGGDSPASVHLLESVEEFQFLRDKTGPIARALDAMGRDWRWWEPPGRPVPWLADRGVLSERLLLVHLVHTDAEDRTLLAITGTPVCLCPRSNLHIGGRLPNAGAMVEQGVRLCLGTDSLASAPDLDVLGEIPVLAAAYPDVPVGTWLDAATQGGALALGFPEHGRIALGARPGLLLLDVARVEDLAVGAPSRRWVLRPGGEA